jgi:hypothetical protein
MDEETIEKVKVRAMSSLLHRNVLGGLGMLLPLFSILGGFFVRNKPESWWYSISVTYYITPALPIILGACGIFLLCYRSYEKIDTIINVLSGIFAFGVVLFPCENPYGIENVGYFQIPVGVSNVIHCVSAMLLFALLSYNIGWLFTKGHNELNNRIYKICAWAMICIMALFVILIIVRSCGVSIPGFLTMIVEAMLLLIFGFAWLVKGRLFKFN